MLYTFWIQPRTGPIIRWTRLTKRQALAMHKNTNIFVDYDEVNSWGWNEEKP